MLKRIYLIFTLRSGIAKRSIVGLIIMIKIVEICLARTLGEDKFWQSLEGKRSGLSVLENRYVIRVEQTDEEGR